MSHRHLALGLGLLLAVFAGGPACEPVDDSGRIDPTVAPSGPVFRPVAQVVLDRCGSLDCHGSKYRNMRLYGFGSTRLEKTHTPEAPDTTPDEVDRVYDAIVALEPEKLRAVIEEGGAEADRLTFLRKALGSEAHKGGGRIRPDDDADRCLRSWLKSAVDERACRRAVPRLAGP